MAQLNTDSGKIMLIRNCPCCNGRAEVKHTKIYYTDAIRIRCTECQLTTSPVAINHPQIKATGLDETTRYTEQQAIQISIDKWNRRV